MLPSVLQPLARLVSSRGDAFAPPELLLSPTDSLAIIFQSTSESCYAGPARRRDHHLFR
jgi:hypothetical protein